jgi:hypothetical protein
VRSIGSARAARADAEPQNRCPSQLKLFHIPSPKASLSNYAPGHEESKSKVQLIYLVNIYQCWRLSLAGRPLTASSCGRWDSNSPTKKPTLEWEPQRSADHSGGRSGKGCIFPRRRVHQTLPTPRSTKGVSSDPSLWITRQWHLQSQCRARQAAHHRAPAVNRSVRATRRAGRGHRRRCRSSPAMPLLRRAHDHCRELWARRRTPRPAVTPSQQPQRNPMTPRHRLTPHTARPGTTLPALHRCRPTISKRHTANRRSGQNRPLDHRPSDKIAAAIILLPPTTAVNASPR